MFLLPGHAFDDVKLVYTPLVEYRGRYERRVDRDFTNANVDGRTDVFTRVRVGGSVDDRKTFAANLIFEYSSDLYWSPAKNSSTEDQDILVANLVLKDKDAKTTIGRQRINIGSERLIGGGDWINTPRSMDGIRFQKGAFDAYVFAPAVLRPVANHRVYGLTYTQGICQSSLIHKAEIGAGKDVRIWTLANATKKKFGETELDFEGALQWGKMNTLDQQAWAFHLSATHPLGAKTKGFVEFNAASGGNNASKNFTFDNLYPTNHKFYGSMDMQGWKNMNEIAFGVTHKATAALDLKANFRTFQLRDARDGWYGAGGGINTRVGGVYRDPTGASGSDVGSEINVEGTYKLGDKASLAGGIGFFNPGGFIKNMNGGTAHRQFWGYFMYTRKM